MITLSGPHAAFNDARAPVTAHMWRTYQVPANTAQQQVIDWGIHAASQAPNGRLRNIVICCHGIPGGMQMGQGFTQSYTHLFSQWAGLVEKIWLRVCEIAGQHDYGRRDVGNGNWFCAQIARAAQCFVLASTELQAAEADRRLPYGQLDTYEGLLLCYNPQGQVSSSHRYPSTYLQNPNDPSSWYFNPD